VTDDNQQAKCVHYTRALRKAPHQWTPAEAETGHVIDVEWTWAEDAEATHSPSQEGSYTTPAPSRLRPRAAFILRGIGLRQPHGGRSRTAILHRGLTRLSMRSHQRDGPRGVPIRPPPMGPDNQCDGR